MIRSGDTLHNPVTGEVIRFVRAAADTGGEYVLMEVVVEPNGAVAAAHVHPYQTEAFEILEGEVTFKAGDRDDRRKGRRYGPHRSRHAAQVLERRRQRMHGSAPRSGPRSSSSRSSRRCSVSPPTARRTGRGCRTRYDSRSSRTHTSTSCGCRSRRRGCRELGLALGAPLGRLLGYRTTYEPAEPSEASLAL